MTIIDKLSSSLNRRDEVPNVELAKSIAIAKDKNGIKMLIGHLQDKNKDIQSDCIKVIYEIASLNPELIAPYAKELVALLDTKNNRLQWGAMTALNAITTQAPEVIYSALAKIIATADKGSVITNDHCVSILIKLCALTKYEAAAFSLLNERLLKSPTNQLPMYAENSWPVINSKTKATFIKTLLSRVGEIEKDTKRKRVEKVLKKLQS